MFRLFEGDTCVSIRAGDVAGAEEEVEGESHC